MAEEAPVKSTEDALKAFVKEIEKDLKDQLGAMKAGSCGVRTAMTNLEGTLKRIGEFSKAHK